jgi:hypothetical protein
MEEEAVERKKAVVEEKTTGKLVVAVPLEAHERASVVI